MQPREDNIQASDELLGAQLGQCHLRALIGVGGMARVYRGRQETLDREVAVKVLPPAFAAYSDFVERFQWEAQATARLVHTNIITVHNAGIDTGRLFIVMDCLAGSLKERMRAGLTIDEVGRIIHDIAAALAYAHSLGIVHRDVKPANILFATPSRAILTDFGIAKALAEADETPLPVRRSGRAAGTPEYMAPEQYQGRTVDARSDIYSLGVTLYEMLTGAPPFQADSYTALEHAHIFEPVPPPELRNPRISPAVQAVLLKALEKDPAERFQAADEMALTLEQAIAAQQPLRLHPTPLTTPHSTPSRTTRPGLPVAPVVLCPRCNARNASTQKFCVQCGYAFTTQRPPTARSNPSAFLTCAHCQSQNQPSDRFCTTCGQPLRATHSAPPRVCPACGAHNAGDHAYCTACGAALG